MNLCKRWSPQSLGKRSLLRKIPGWRRRCEEIVHPILGKPDLSGASQRQRSQDSDEAVGFLKSRDDGEKVAEVLEERPIFSRLKTNYLLDVIYALKNPFSRNIMLRHVEGALFHIQSCLSSAFSFLHTAKSHRDAPFTALEMVEQELVTEDEFANRDEMGLQPLTDTTETEDAAFWKYVIWTKGILGQVF